MALSNAHEGYEYQDLLTCYFILQEILEENRSSFLIDRKEFSGDKIDDLTIISDKGRQKKQLKYSNADTDHRLCKNDLSSEAAYQLSLDTLYLAWLDHPEKNQSSFRICLAWLPPTDSLLDILIERSNQGSFSKFQTTVYQIDPEKLWPENAAPIPSWQRFNKAAQKIDRDSFKVFCAALLIEVGMPKLSLNLQNPGDLEGLVLQQTKNLGIGVYPNEHYREETFILALLAIVKRSRSKNMEITTQGIFHELRIATDFGSIEQHFPILEQENIQRSDSMQDFIDQHRHQRKLLLLGEPGGGKSWFIENLTSMLRKKGIHVLRHLCYTKLDDTFQKDRIKLNVFYGNLIAELLQAYPALKALKEKRYASSLNELNHLLGQISQQTYIFIDGLDHIERIASFRNFSDISRQDRAIIETISSLRDNPLVSIIVSSQQISELGLISGFEKVSLPAWTEREVRAMLKKREVTNSPLTKKLLLSGFLLEKSAANPLYLKYLIDEVAKMQGPDLAQLQALPEYAFNLSGYYTYLLSQLNTREEVPQVLSGVGFSLTRTELEEITGAGLDVVTSLEILSPVLAVNISQSGYRIYHESFRRFILEYLSARQISVEKKIFRPIREWFSSKDFFSYPKAYRYQLQFLFEGENHEEIIQQLSHTFVTDSKINGYSWELIEKNYGYFVKAACILQHFPSIILLNEIDKVLASCKEEFEELFPQYIRTLGKVFGFKTVSEYLLFEGQPAMPAAQGIEACYVCDEHQTSAPWPAYMSFFPPGSQIKGETFKYCLRGLLVLQDEKRLEKLAKHLTKHTQSSQAETFRKELQGFANKEYIDKLRLHYPIINKILDYKAKPASAGSVKEVLELAHKILDIDDVHESEKELIFRLIRGCAAHHDDDALHQSVKKLLQSHNWFYNWLIYTISINRLNSQSPYSAIKEAFDHLAFSTDPFQGQPRACDLYSIQGFIFQSLHQGLKLIKTAQQWQQTIDTLVKVSDETTTNLQRSTNGPLTTNKLFGILSTYSCKENADYINTIFKLQLAEKEQYRLHSDIAEYNLYLASLSADSGAVEAARAYFSKALQFALGYTMRKDQTLRDLIVAIGDYGRLSPKKLTEDLVLSRMLVDSAVDHTDGRETDYFPNLWFEGLLKIDRDLSMAYLLHQLKSSRFDWRAEKSLAHLLIQLQGSLDPRIESYLALTLPVNTDSAFIACCLDLYHQTSNTHSYISEKLAGMIVPAMQPKQNRNRGEALIETYNSSLGQQFGQVPLNKKTAPSFRSEKKWYHKCIQRKEFSLMGAEERVAYFDENAFTTQDLPALSFLLDSLNALSESTCELISTVISRNNNRYEDKLELDWVFQNGGDIECFYWVCRFLNDRGGWYEKFINQEAFHKAHALNPELAFAKLFEQLPDYLEIGNNTEFSANLIKLLISLDYDRATIEQMWANLKTMSAYRLPVQQPIDWAEETGNPLKMDGTEMLLSMLICRFRAATVHRYRLTCAALESILDEFPDKLIKPFQWFFTQRNSFEKSAELIVLQLLYRQEQKNPGFKNHFRALLCKDFPSRYFLSDWIISFFYGLKLSSLVMPAGISYNDLHAVQIQSLRRRNRRYSIFEMQWIDIHQAFSKHVNTYRQQYSEHLEIYTNRVYKRFVPHIQSAEHLLEIFNQDYYQDFKEWSETESEESLTLDCFLAIDSVATYGHAMTTRPADLPLPCQRSEIESSTEFEPHQGWIRLAHTEEELQQGSIFELTTHRSFGGTMFCAPKADQNPYSSYQPFPFQLWGEKRPRFDIEKQIIFAILQDDPIEYYRLLWVNPDLLAGMGIRTKRVPQGLIGINESDQLVLKMRTWCCDYLGDDFRTRLSDEIPSLQGTDLIIRPDYFERLKSHFTDPPVYYSDTLHEKKKKWQQQR
ncbi:hypothetical protein QWY86_03190 [Pedobacter aquatilis]|uniref:hypothetical protein n=1 Tax=Pedobacter aquatilis TaxID=351343 RepID=UPI0025B5447E|nr:hypothetical protein [Pedobacter aquatilis]MDN3585656.1 hypothetical protein [Pedobacter aquatilis]